MKEQIENIVKKQNGTIVYIDEEAKLVLWQNRKKEFVVHSICNNNDNFFLESGSYTSSIEQGMLKFLTRKNYHLEIKVNVSEEDIYELRNGERLDWCFNDEKSNIPIDVTLYCTEDNND